MAKQKQQTKLSDLVPDDRNANKHYVYQHTRLDRDEIFYIGIGSDPIFKRAHTHNGRNKTWKGIVSKTDFRVDILFSNIPFEFAKRKEKELILFYGRKDLRRGSLCNLTDGGEGTVGVVFSKEHCLKISKRMKGQKPSEETRKKLSKIQSNRSDEWNKKIAEAGIGRVASDTALEKMRLSNLGKKRSQETKERIRVSKLGTVISEKQRREHSKKMMGNKHSLGHKHTDETKLKMRIAGKAKVFSTAHKANLTKALLLRWENKKQKIA